MGIQPCAAAVAEGCARGRIRAALGAFTRGFDLLNGLAMLVNGRKQLVDLLDPLPFLLGRMLAVPLIVGFANGGIHGPYLLFRVGNHAAEPRGFRQLLRFLCDAAAGAGQAAANPFKEIHA